MHHIARRSLMGTGLVGAATLASALGARKPRAQQNGAREILTLKPEPAVKLLGIDALKPTDPPATPAAQDFSDVDGATTTLAAFAGKGVVLNLWATWCVPCVAEMPALDALAERLKSDDIMVVPVSSDRGAATVVRKFYAAHAVKNLGIWLDPKGLAARGWGARGLPTTLIIDREGRERGRLEGGAEWSSDEAVAMIRKLVG